jgi:hypothetical protein
MSSATVFGPRDEKIVIEGAESHLVTLPVLILAVGAGSEAM